MRSWISCLVAGLLALVSSTAFAADSPRAGLLTSATDNFSYALKAICFAYVFDGQDDVVKTRWGVASAGWGEQSMFKKENMQAHLVGVAGRINVGVKTENGVRRCDIEAKLGDPNAYRQRLLEIVAERPEPFSPLKSPIYPNRFAFRDGWCGPSPSTSFILASTAKPGDGVAILVLVESGGPREPRCDRWDIGAGVGSPIPVTKNTAPPGSADATAIQRALLSALSDICVPGLMSESAPQPLDPGAWKPVTLEEKDRVARFGRSPTTPYQSIAEPHLFVAKRPGAHVCLIFADAGDPNALFDAAKDAIAKRPEGLARIYEDDHSAVYCKEQSPQPAVVVLAKGSHHDDQFIFRILADQAVPGEHCLAQKH